MHIDAMDASVDWSPEKNAELKARYGFGFERILVALGEGGLLDERTHPNTERYPHQRQFVVRIDRYAWVVPFVQSDAGIFLKTIYPSRKATRDFQGVLG